MTREEAVKNVIAYAYLNCAELPKDVYLAFDVLVNTSKGIDKAIEEISTMSHWQSDDGQDLVMVADVLEAIKRNIGE